MQKEIQITHQISHIFYQKYPHIEYNEILAESNLAMIKAISTYDPVKGRTLNSWIGFLIHRELRKKFKEDILCLEYNDELQRCDRFNPERLMMFKESINSLSKAAKESIKIVLQKNIYTKKEIKQELRLQGFAYNKIQTAFCELRKVF